MITRKELKEILTTDIEQTISELEKIFDSDSQYYDDLILQRARLTEIKRGKRAGIISHGDYDLKLADIRLTIIGLINIVEEVVPTNKPDNVFFDTRGLSNVIKSNLRSDLFKQHNVFLKLDKAPDGIDRYLKVSRSSWEFLGEEIANETEPEQLVYSIKNIFEQINKLILLKDYLELESETTNSVYAFQDSNFVSLEAIINTIKKNTNNLSILKNIGIFSSSTLNGPHYISRHNIRHIFPRTTFSQIIGDHSPLNKLADKFSFFALPYDKIEHRQKGNITKHTKHFSTLISNKHFAFDLLSEHVRIVNFDSDNNCKIKESRALVDEDMSFYEPTFIIQEKDNHQKVAVGSLGDFRSYTNNLFQIIRKEGRINIKFKLKKSRLILGLISLCDEISKLHEKGLIHGDLNPKNILTLEKGFYPIDSINIPNGAISPGLTPNFCAPEQVLRKAVSPATDIYNLGLILIMITEGILFGKVDKFVFPSSRSELEEAVLLVDPKIYFSNNASAVPPKGIKSWTAFIEQCIKFEQSSRISSIKQFQSKLIGLQDKYPVRGEVEFRPAFGGLSIIQTGDEHKGLLGRIINDKEDSGEAVNTVYFPE